MNNFQQPGFILDLIAPTGGVTKAVPVRIGDFFCIPQETALVSVAFRGYVSGVFELVKDAGTAWTAGQAVYWDVSATEVTHNPLLGDCIGYAVAAATSAAVLADVQLNGVSVNSAQGVQVIRKRATIAELNAGVEMLPAILGRKYSMVDCHMTAIGGASTAVTTVDVLATLSTAQKLMAGAQATMTQSTLVRAGGTGGAVLADGASFIPMDANTAITLGVTGSDITTATHVDVVFFYTIGV